MNHDSRMERSNVSQAGVAGLRCRACPCTIVPPHILERLAASRNPKLRAAGMSTLIGNQTFRLQRQLLGAAPRISARAGQLRRTVYTCNQSPDLPGLIIREEGKPPVNDSTVDEAYEGAGDTYRFFDAIFSRNSVDGRGLRLDSSVHYREDPSQPYDNAFWNGEQMVYGDGDEVIFTRFTKSLDVIAHELTHGITQFEANLKYHNQPGALNESMSDVFGSMVKQWKLKQTIDEADWLIGNEIMVSPGIALRSLKAPGTAYVNDPELKTDPQPDRMSNYATLPDTRIGDWGGVHINSGIPNRAFYQACVNLGAQHSWEKAGQIWYRVLCDRLGPKATFSVAAAACVSVAKELFGADEADAVRAAWEEVEVEAEVPARERPVAVAGAAGHGRETRAGARPLPH